MDEYIPKLQIKQHTSPPQISYWIIFLSKFSPSSIAPEAENLLLNIPSKGIVDQDCLINYVGCDENLKCVGFLTLQLLYCFDFHVLEAH